MARKNGLNVRDVVDALNAAAFGPDTDTSQHASQPINLSQEEKPPSAAASRWTCSFRPETVAVIGATENAEHRGPHAAVEPGDQPVRRHGLSGESRSGPACLGVKAYPSISAIPEEVDLAVIVTPPPSHSGHHPRMRRKRRARRHRDFGRLQGDRARRARRSNSKLLEAARAADIRVIGPNCLGVMSPLSGLNATFATTIARPGSVGFISQSGALCTAVLDWSLKEMVGFSAFVSVGSMVDVGWGDLIYHLGNDPKTRSIVIYMETIGNARAFLSAAREVALNKPIIVIKPGRIGGRRQGRGFAHRLAHRQRRGAGSRLPPQRRAARQQHRRPVLHGGSAFQAAQPARARA